MAEQLTIEQVEELYAGVRLRFQSYYKYVFTFSGTASDGVKIIAMYGGGSEEIYRHDVTNNEERPLGKGFQHYWMSVNLTNTEGEQLFSGYYF